MADVIAEASFEIHASHVLRAIVRKSAYSFFSMVHLLGLPWITFALIHFGFRALTFATYYLLAVAVLCACAALLWAVPEAIYQMRQSQPRRLSLSERDMCIYFPHNIVRVDLGNCHYATGSTLDDDLGEFLPLTTAFLLQYEDQQGEKHVVSIPLDAFARCASLGQILPILRGPFSPRQGGRHWRRSPQEVAVIAAATSCGLALGELANSVLALWALQVAYGVVAYCVCVALCWSIALLFFGGVANAEEEQVALRLFPFTFPIVMGFASCVGVTCSQMTLLHGSIIVLIHVVLAHLGSYPLRSFAAKLRKQA